LQLLDSGLPQRPIGPAAAGPCGSPSEHLDAHKGCPPS
jgi:hypothetical protein